MENQSTNEHRNYAGEQLFLEMHLEALEEAWGNPQELLEMQLEALVNEWDTPLEVEA